MLRFGQFTFAVAVALVFAPQGHAETLQQSLTRAAENNPAIKASLENRNAISKNKMRARAGFLPKLTGSADYSRTWNDQTGAATTRSNSKGASLQVTQPIFDGLKSYNALGQAKAQTKQAAAQLRDTEQRILLEAATAHADLYYNQRILKVLKNYQASLHQQKQLVQKLQNFGEAVRGDVAAVDARVASAEAQLSRALANVEASAAVYEQIVGATPQSLSEPLAATGTIPATRAQALQLALNDHPQIIAAQFAAAEAKFQRAAAQSDLSPTLEVVGSRTWRETDNLKTDSTAVLAQARWNFFDGGDTWAKISQSKAVLRQRDHELSVVKNQIRAETLSAWSALQDAKHRIAAGKRQAAAARTSLQSVRAAYKAGERSNFDVLDAEQLTIDANQAELIARRDYVVASFRLARATGQLSYNYQTDAAENMGDDLYTSTLSAVPIEKILKVEIVRPTKKLAKRKSPKAETPKLRPVIGDEPFRLNTL